MAITIPNTFADKSGQVQLQDLDENFSQIAIDLNSEVTSIQNEVDAALNEVQAAVESIEDPVAMSLLFGPDPQVTYEGRYLKNIYTQVDTGNYSTTTTWAIGPSFADVSGFSAGSILKVTYHMPCRNDSTTWGGAYIEPQIRYNSGTWQSLGSSGFDAVMEYGQSIGSYFQTLLIDPGQTSSFSVGFRFYFRSYDGTVTINLNHDINAISGTATIIAGNTGLQHYAKIIVEEYALL